MGPLANSGQPPLSQFGIHDIHITEQLGGRIAQRFTIRRHGLKPVFRSYGKYIE